jgi:hypothetical protein
MEFETGSVVEQSILSTFLLFQKLLTFYGIRQAAYLGYQNCYRCGWLVSHVVWFSMKDALSTLRWVNQLLDLLAHPARVGR